MSAPKVICVIGIYLLACEILEFMVVRKHAADTFPPKLGWRMLRWIFVALALAAIGQRFYGQKPEPGDAPIWVAFCLLFVGVIWPRTVLVGADGISSCATFGIRRRMIPWIDVGKVTSDWEEVQTRLGFRFLGTRIYVLSRDGSRIAHGIVQSRQAKFLDELRKHLPRETFAPGLYDWRPNAETKWDWSLRS
jgi:hypothetical protein